MEQCIYVYDCLLLLPVEATLAKKYEKSIAGVHMTETKAGRSRFFLFFLTAVAFEGRAWGHHVCIPGLLINHMVLRVIIQQHSEGPVGRRPLCHAHPLLHSHTVPIKWGGKISNCEHLKSYRAALSLISFCGRLFALKISARHSASRHNAHVVVINHNYHGLKKPQLLFDFKNKP